MKQIPLCIKQFKAQCKAAARLSHKLSPSHQDLRKLQELERAIRAQFSALRPHLRTRTLVRMMAAAGCALVLNTTPLAAQSIPNFVAPVNNPFSLSVSSNYEFPHFADLDNDSDLDILAGNGDGFIIYYQNTGTAAAPNYAAGIPNPFGMDTLPNRTSTPFLTFGDLDADGDLDVMRGESENGDFWYYENTGTVNSATFAAPQKNQFGLTGLVEYTLPNFADLDMDGDLDLLVADEAGNLQYYQNTGTTTQAAFANPVLNPFGWVGPNVFTGLTVGDLDQDGDFDVMGSSYGNWRYYENTGTATNPSFSVTSNPFGLQMNFNIYGPQFGDLDGDGDLDIMTANEINAFSYLQNDAMVTAKEGQKEILSLDYFPNPVQTELQFRWENTDANAVEMIAIYDLQGRKLKRILVKKGQQSAKIQMADLPEGAYVLELTHEKGSTKRRFFKGN